LKSQKLVIVFGIFCVRTAWALSPGGPFYGKCSEYKVARRPKLVYETVNPKEQHGRRNRIGGTGIEYEKSRKTNG